MPVLAFKGILESPDGSVRVSNLNIYGIDRRFWDLGQPAGGGIDIESFNGFPVSESVASRLGEIDGDFLLRMQPPSQLSSDLIFSTDVDTSRAWPVKIGGAISDDVMGRFSLQTQQDIPLNIFVPIEWLAEKAQVPGKANMLLCKVDGANSTEMDKLSVALKNIIQLEDMGLHARKLDGPDVIELVSSRIFLEESVADAAMKAGVDTYGVFTYFVNEIRAGEKSVPYSMVTAESENGPIPALGTRMKLRLMNGWPMNWMQMLVTKLS